LLRILRPETNFASAKVARKRVDFLALRLFNFEIGLTKAQLGLLQLFAIVLTVFCRILAAALSLKLHFWGFTLPTDWESLAQFDRCQNLSVCCGCLLRLARREHRQASSCFQLRVMIWILVSLRHVSFISPHPLLLPCFIALSLYTSSRRGHRLSLRCRIRQNRSLIIFSSSLSR